ncbi:MAG TPA: aldo/keto reductase [Rhizomicrobium sp.]|jgi:aryl-alcohol dehydrogenase-like predicted oxidoreductase
MELRNLGRSGLRVSVVGLGCNNFGMLDIEASRKVVHRALDLGITLFDTADVYGKRGGSEEQLGEILGPRRKHIVLATKFGMAMDDEGKKKGASRRYILEAVEASLSRLKTDWIDLYQLHTPDPETPLEETLGALDELVRSGKVRHIGCSNMPAAQVKEAARLSREKRLAGFVCAQDEYSLLVRDIERELIPALEAEHMGLLPYFPLASGLLTGKYRRGEDIPSGTRMAVMTRLADRYMTEKNWAIVEKLRAFCEARGHSMLELAFSWLASRKVVSSVIAGATKPDQVEQNVQAASWSWSSDDLAEIDRITTDR